VWCLDTLTHFDLRPHYYCMYCCRLTASAFGSTTYSAQSAMAMVEAQRAGIGQGELQAGLSSLNAISHVLAPLVMSRLFEMGGGRFYCEHCSCCCLQATLSRFR